jgi:pimeloyl-ACP methyl ester carboxylesterase
MPAQVESEPFAMSNSLGRIAESIIAVTTFVLLLQGPSAFAQNGSAQQVNGAGDAYFVIGAFDIDRKFELQAAKDSAAKFAGYYAPYAIQAALAYFPDHLIKGGPDDFGDETNVEKAKRLFRQWQFQFDSDSYVICAKPSDKDCNNDQPNRWILFSTNGLYYQVWARYRPNNSCSEVSIAFRGTENSTLSSIIASWSSNLHSLSRVAHVDDEYYQLARRVDAIIQQIKQLKCYQRAGGAQIVSVGHSLGGGLAEFAALAHDPKVGRIAKVFTFNASPVTAPDLITDSRWNDSRQGLIIDRIYQEGEVLTAYSAVRDRQQTPALGCNPQVRTVQFSAVKPGAPKTRLQKVINFISPSAYGAYERHGIGPLASKLVEWTNENQVQYEIPGGLQTNCVPEPDYKMPSPPPAQGNELISYGVRPSDFAAANFDFAGTVSRRNKKSSRGFSRRETYGPAAAGLVDGRPTQFGPIYPGMIERSVSVAKSTKVNRPAAAPLLGDTAEGRRLASF